ncbi:MAG: hypothetical protein D6812_12895 [Deltaproteobacteria bacterium]|nr:MAG: hypothetical protein D6812_12895 [Deltaproteobacteria bacterium]
MAGARGGTFLGRRTDDRPPQPADPAPDLGAGGEPFPSPPSRAGLPGTRAERAADRADFHPGTSRSPGASRGALSCLPPRNGSRFRPDSRRDPRAPLPLTVGGSLRNMAPMEPHPSHAPEEALLLRCARFHDDGNRARATSEALAEQSDPLRLMDLAARHGMMPLLYRHLAAHAPGALERGALRQLPAYCHATRFHNRLLARELLTACRMLHENGILAIPFKGPTLAVLAYGDLALRQFGDIDLMVPRRDARKARERLSEVGFMPARPLSAEREGIYLDNYHAYSLEKGEIQLDLHWRLAQRSFAFDIDLSLLSGRLVSVRLLEEEIPTFAPSDLLLILAVHASKHLWTRLIWICDIAALVSRHPDVDWGALLAFARRCGARRMLLLALFLARHFCATELPEGVRAEVEKEPHLSPLAGNVEEALFGERPVTPGDALRFHVRMRERFGDKLRRILTPNLEEMLRFPPPFLWLAYLLRPLRLLSVRHSSSGFLPEGRHDG